jgi:hypothetical protein
MAAFALRRDCIIGQISTGGVDNAWYAGESADGKG